MSRPKQNPEVNMDIVEPVESVEPEITDPCWNCGSQLETGRCKECGFDKSLLHNLKLEEERAKEISKLK